MVLGNGGTGEIVVLDMVGTGDMVPWGVHDRVPSTLSEKPSSQSNSNSRKGFGISPSAVGCSVLGPLLRHPGPMMVCLADSAQHHPMVLHFRLLTYVLPYQD